MLIRVHEAVIKGDFVIYGEARGELIIIMNAKICALR